jgi:hypothetical protein
MKALVGVMIVLIVVLSIGGFILGSRTNSEVKNGTIVPSPSDEATCTQSGGKWVSVDSPDISQKCSLPTGDSGIECRDNGECESGLCIPDANGKGTCYGWSVRPPCSTSLIAGEVQPEACMDTAPGDTPGSAPASDNLPQIPEETGDNLNLPVPNEACGIQECHGLDITCGPVPPNIMCTLEYKLGDKCRAHASCEVKNGVCQLSLSPEFTQCKECAEQCSKNNDLISAFQCESGC